jgi:polyferredoxin
MFLLLAFVLISLLMRKAFCGWLCPIGTVSEWLWKAGRATFKRNFAPPRWLDIALRGLKYVLLGLFGYAVASMTAPALREFLESPYGLVADVKMLNFFRYLSTTAAFTLAFFAIASVFVRNVWCRYLCPYGALVGLAAWLSPMRITRRKQSCIDCARCAKACPANLPVDRLARIRSAECTGCFECVAACPVADTLDMRVARRRVPAAAVAAGIAIVFFGIVAYARLSGHWKTDVPAVVYQELIPKAREFSHP